MPRKQDFSKSTIYHIRNKETKYVVYVGSSCEFTQRQYKHKSCCNNNKSPQYNQPIYVYIREHGGWECYEVIPVSFHNFKNNVQLRIQEQTEIDKYSHAMNKNKAYITVEDAKERKKEYRSTHAEELKQYQKDYSATHLEEIKAYKKEYRATHAEEIIEKRKEYYATHTEEICEKRKEKIECPLCKRIVSRGNLSTHQKTKHCIASNK